MGTVAIHLRWSHCSNSLSPTSPFLGAEAISPSYRFFSIVVAHLVDLLPFSFSNFFNSVLLFYFSFLEREALCLCPSP